MHTGALKKWALALTFWLALHTSLLKAQILGPYTVGPNTFQVDASGLWDTGAGTGSLSLSGAGTRMFWYSGKAAFRAGSISIWNPQGWDAANIGQYSTAFGIDTTASGSASVAMGGASCASGSSSVALGGASWANGESSIALGDNTHAIGFASTALGYGTNAMGPYSTTLGLFTAAYFRGALATGGQTSASGYYAFTGGVHTTASAYGSFVIGRWNNGGGNPTTWVATDPLFEIGNGSPSTGSAYYGTYQTHPSDAFVVYKNGNATLQGALTAQDGMRIPPKGDLSMGSFTAGTPP